MATRTVWHLPWLSNVLWGLTATCAICVVLCYVVWPKDALSDDETVIRTDPAPDPAAQGKGGGNKDDTGPTIVVPRGSKNKVPRDSTVRVEDEAEHGGRSEATEE